MVGIMAADKMDMSLDPGNKPGAPGSEIPDIPEWIIDFNEVVMELLKMSERIGEISLKTSETLYDYVTFCWDGTCDAKKLDQIASEVHDDFIPENIAYDYLEELFSAFKMQPVYVFGEGEQLSIYYMIKLKGVDILFNVDSESWQYWTPEDDLDCGAERIENMKKFIEDINGKVYAWEG